MVNPPLTDRSYAADVTLSLAVLGPPQVSLSAQPITHFRFERVRALLYYLAVEMETSHDRTALCTLFWPEASPNTASQNLRQTLCSLRRALKDQAREVPFLLITPKTLRFNPASNHVLDYVTFVQLLEQSQYHPHRRLSACDSCIRRYRQAAELYRGDFLAGLTVDSELFQEWARARREALYEQVMHLLTDLVECHLERGEYHEAIHLIQRQLELDPLCDEANHRLIHALAADHRRNAALLHYDRYSRLLGEELAVAPPPETRALVDLLRGGSWQPPSAPVSPPHRIPAESNAFVGYESELDYLSGQVANRHCRLLTITGPCGSGKTRIALRLAWSERQNFRDGVFFVDLREVTPGNLPAAVAAALPLEHEDEGDVSRRIRAWLKDREALLILDNFDHLVHQAAWLVRLQQQAPELTLLVTSREWLKVQGETVMVLRGLQCPPPGDVERMEQYPTVQLFLENVRRLQPDFQLTSPADRENLAALCGLVGGLPLALQMIASWVTLYSPDALVGSVVSSLEFLSSPLRSMPGWQRRMASVFLLALRGLSPKEQQVYCRLSIFAHSFTVEAAEAIAQATAPILMTLQSKSLLHYIPWADPDAARDGTEPGLSFRRYEIPPLLRFLAAEMLGRQSHLATRLLAAHHSRFYLALLRREAKHLDGPCEYLALQYLRADIGNIEQAWQWALEQKQHAVVASVQSPLVSYYMAVGERSRAARVLDEAIACLRSAASGTSQVRAAD